MIWRAVALAVLAVGSAGCTAEHTPASLTTVPLGPPDRAGFESALARGQLVVRKGCALITGPGGTVAAILWPAGTEFRGDEAHLVGGTVLDTSGDAEVELGGGYSDAASEEVAENDELQACVEATGVSEVFIFSGAVG